MASSHPRPMHPIVQLLLLVALMMAGACVALAVIFMYAGTVLHLPVADISNVLARPAGYPQGWALSMVSQGVLLFGALGGGALALASLQGYRWADYFAPRRLGQAWWPLAAGLLIICTFPFMSGLIAWNAGAHFPAFLHDFEVWARAKEDQAAELIKYLTNFNSTARLLVGLVVVAVVPAVAEELVFRGVVQRNLVRWFGSRHAGVWLAAAIFSAIHMQFFGFVPRFVLGLLLGYLYEWSGNILVPMAAHFTQNAFQLLLLYLSQHGQLGPDFEPESTDAMPWWTMLVSALVSAALLWLLHQRMSNPAAPTQHRTLSREGLTEW